MSILCHCCLSKFKNNTTFKLHLESSKRCLQLRYEKKKLEKTIKDLNEQNERLVESLQKLTSLF